MEGSSAADCKISDGLEEIRTPDPRRVKAEVRELTAAFSDVEPDGKTTTRKASAPWCTV